MMRLPPYAVAMGIVPADAAIVEADPAAAGALLAMPFGDHLIGRPGFLQGGAIAGLMEMAAQIELRRALEGAEVGIKPITVTVDYLRGGRPAIAYAAADITRLGGRIANVVATAWQDDRTRPMATARLTILLKR